MTPDAATALDEVTWNLADLLEGEGAGESASDEAVVGALLDRADGLAEEFARAHEGRVGELDGTGLIEAMERLAEISELAGRALNYAHLRFAADTEDPANGALAQRRERARHPDPDQASLLRARVGRDLRRAGRGAARDRRARLLRGTTCGPSGATGRTC